MKYLTKLALAFLLCAPAARAAEPLPALICSGVEPGWTLELEGGAGLLTPETGARATVMTIAQRTIADGRPYPRALTLISRTQTAIALVNRRACFDTASDVEYPFAADLLTQKRGLPALLTGCCRIVGVPVAEPVHEPVAEPANKP